MLNMSEDIQIRDDHRDVALGIIQRRNTAGQYGGDVEEIAVALAKAEHDARQRIAREVLAWCDDPDVFDKVAEKSVHAVRAVAFSIRDPEWVKRLKYEVR